MNKELTETNASYLPILKKYIDQQCNSLSLTPIKKEQIYQNMIRILLSAWQPFVKVAYDLTSRINHVGVYESDLIHHYKVTTMNPHEINRLKTEGSDWICKQIFDNNYNVHYPQNHTNVQLFYAMENDRYLLSPVKSFQTAGSDLMRYLVMLFDKSDSIWNNVNNSMLRTLKLCEQTGQLHPKLKYLVIDNKNVFIPLA